MPLGKIDEDYQKLSKQSVGNLISKAQSHAKKGEKLKARELYELVLKDFPKNKRARLGLASIVADSNTIMGSYIPQSILNELVNLYSDRNGDRMPDYHRLDLAATLKLNTKKETNSSELNLSIYNAYSRLNAYSINFDTNEAGVTEATRLALFGMVPSVTWNFKF